MDLESAAAELYVLPPAEFVGRRAQLAKAARTGGDKTVADQVKRLAKPSAAAWVVNLLATRRPSEFEEVATLGAAFREAVFDGDAGVLASLSAERRSAIHRAADSAFDLAVKAQDRDSSGETARGSSARGGAQPSPATRADVEQTLQAVLADAGAAAAARTGRLVRALASTGVEAVDLTDAVGGPFEAPEVELEDDDEPGRVDAGTGPDAGKDPDADPDAGAGQHGDGGGETDAKGEAAAQAETAAQAEPAARHAREALEALEGQLDDLKGLRKRAREESDALADEIDVLQKQLDEVGGRLRERQARFDDLEGRLDETDRQFGRLDRQRERAARLAETTAKGADRGAVTSRAQTQKEKKR